jgi:hypothetical protein
MSQDSADTNDKEKFTKWKIFPRNLTANSDYMVTGNPATTRLESGVGNNWPGLEFDDRNLEKVFFPGLYFEFQRDEGAILHSILPNGEPRTLGLVDADLPLYLWGIIGKINVDQARPEFFSFDSLDGQEVFRRIHNLPPGDLVVILGREPVANMNLSLPPDSIDFINDHVSSGNSGIFRDVQNNLVKVAVFIGRRSDYIDENGVIDVNDYPPGDLTRTMCCPWQYDFRDCGCFFWAAGKPDIVTSEDGKHPNLNFQRKNRSTSPPEEDIPMTAGRRDRELGHEDLIAGEWWNKLPVVLNDKENQQVAPAPSIGNRKLLDRAEVIKELRYLATVEHALSVEYLYAHYSINSPPFIPLVMGDYSLNKPLNLPESPTKDKKQRIFAAAKEVFMIAIDEMRHLRWVNEALDLLGEPPSLERTDCIRSFNKPFKLEPLTTEQLNWFIDVERPSQSMNEGNIDGMYVWLHTSIQQQPDEFPEHERLTHLIKLIIDEGGDHYERFLSIKRHLEGITEDEYLRNLSNPPEGTSLKLSQDLCNDYYSVLLNALYQSFSLGDKAGGMLLEQARRSMFNLHEICNYVASKGVHIPFKLPNLNLSGALDSIKAHSFVNSVFANLNKTASQVNEKGEEKEREMANKQQKFNDELYSLMHRLIDENLK